VGWKTSFTVQNQQLFGLYPSSYDSHISESIMLQGQDWSNLGKKLTLIQAPNDLSLKIFSTTMLQRALPVCTAQIGIPLIICHSMGKGHVPKTFCFNFYFQHLILVEFKRINDSKWHRPQSKCKGKIEKLCCPWPTLSVGLYFILLYHTLLINTMSAHLQYQFTFMPHVCDRTMLIYVIVSFFRTSNEGPSV